MKKAAAIILSAAMLMGCSVSCGPEDNKGYIEAGLNDMGTFDFERAVGDIELYGTAVKLPGTFDDLGSGFTVKGAVETEEGDSAGSAMTLLHNGETVGSIILENCREGDVPNGKRILYLEFTDMDNFKMDGISGKSTIENVKERFGDSYSADTLYISYSGKNGQYIEFYKMGAGASIIQYVAINF